MKGVYTHLKPEDNTIISLVEDKGRSFSSIKAFYKDLPKKSYITLLMLLISFVSVAQKIENPEQAQAQKASANYCPGDYTIIASTVGGNQGGVYSASTTVSITEPDKLICGVQWPYESTNDQPACGNDDINILQLAAIGGTGPYTYQIFSANPSWFVNGPNSGTMVDGINEFNFYAGDGASTVQFTIRDKNGFTTTCSVDLKACVKLKVSSGYTQRF